MASQPYLDKRRGVWYTKARLERDGKHKAVRLGKHDAPYPPSKPPRKPPAYILDAHHEVELREARVKSGFETGGANGTDLEAYLAAHADRYEASRGGPSKSGKALRRLSLALLAFAGERKVKTVQQADRAFLRDFMEYRAGKVSANSLRVEKGTLSPVWSRAAEDGLIPSNPWQFVRPPGKKTEHTPRFYSSEEIGKLAAACNVAWHRDAVLLLANTGIRVSAALAMRWDWVDWGRSVVTVPREHDKAGKGYQVAMSAGARDVLQRRHAASRSALVFPSPKHPERPPCYSTFLHAFARLCKSAGVPAGTPHDLRHSYARHLCETAPINVVQAALGHSSLAMTQRYTKVGGASAARYVEGFDLGGGAGEGGEPPPANPPA